MRVLRKVTTMVFNLNEFLMSVSFALDFVEIDLLGLPTNHGKRVAYMALKMAEKFGMSEKEKYDIVSLGILHDNGVSERILRELSFIKSQDIRAYTEGAKSHCIVGEENIKDYPFMTNVTNILKYHHERYDGGGFFGLKGEEIPVMSQVIFLADRVEIEFAQRGLAIENKKEVLDYINREKGTSFSPEIVNGFTKVCQDEEFWQGLKDDNITSSLRNSIPVFTVELTLSQLHTVTKVFSKIIDSKSKFTLSHSEGLSNKVEIMAGYYDMEQDEKMKLAIAADLHDIGKLAVSNNILDKPGKLNVEEFSAIKKHAYYTRLALEQIEGFEDITEWAANHHEKLNGTGYPLAKTAEELDFNSRLLGCLDIYQALIEERPYRSSLTHEEAMGILIEMKEHGLIDGRIVEDINAVFSELKEIEL